MQPRRSLFLVWSVFFLSCGADNPSLGVQAQEIPLQEGSSKSGPCTSQSGQTNSQAQGSTQAETSTGGNSSSTAPDASSDHTGSALDRWPPDAICIGRENGAPCGRYSLCLMQRCMPTICGDGVIMPYEECEDGNDEVNDGCDACILERCGDGILHPGEECDDGNNLLNDGCTNQCRRTKKNLCGNGKIDGKEECDDGNLSNEDGCRNDCRHAPAPRCGNRQLDPGEECDDGDHQENDGCGPNCKLERCGDGFVYAVREQCDDANTRDGDGCSAKCQVEYAVCGNGIVEVGEQCDDGNNRNSDACPNDCLLAICGDGLREGRESCDDGNTVAGDGCDANCVRETACGNGIVEFAVGGEHCDDGNNNNYDRCPNDCKHPVCGDGRWGGYVEECDGSDVPQPGQECDAKCRIKPVCGNGIVEITGSYPELSEVCDDGNTEGEDGCASNCKSTVSASRCGNGVLDPGEECDLGADNDDWTADAEYEPNRKIGACRGCRWTFFNESCSRCMQKIGRLRERNACASWGTRPCNAVFSCYIENRCSSFFDDDALGRAANASFSCACGDISTEECTNATALRGPCEAIATDPKYMFMQREDGSRSPIEGTQNKVAYWQRDHHPSGRANGTVAFMARKCSQQCGAFMLSKEQLELGKKAKRRRRQKK